MSVSQAQSFIRCRSQPARMRCGKSDDSSDTELRLLSQPARMRCGKYDIISIFFAERLSQPARMRCGKFKYSNYLERIKPVATRTNALWQMTAKSSLPKLKGRVATRTNALWQIRQDILCGCRDGVATRTNALWQILQTKAHPNLSASQPARMRCGKCHIWKDISLRFRSQPARMRCGKSAKKFSRTLAGFVATRTNALWQICRK